MAKVKLLLVIGPGGGRMDFVAGWLGTLPNFIGSGWSIDPVTRQSSGNMRFTKVLDQGATLESFWPMQFQLSADAKLTVTGTGHGVHLSAIQDKIDAGLIKVLSINASEPATDFNKIRWEFVTKTYLSQDKLTHLRTAKRKEWLIDYVIDKPSSEITNNERIRAVDQILKEPVNKYHYINGSTDIEYNVLFQPNGSRQLCDQLGIVVEDAYHDYWNTMLTLVDSPDTLTVWGHTWNKKDYFTD